MCESLAGLGVRLVTSETEAEMRLCTSLVDERFGETTEIIEPWSAEVIEQEWAGIYIYIYIYKSKMPSNSYAKGPY